MANRTQNEERLSSKLTRELICQIVVGVCLFVLPLLWAHVWAAVIVAFPLLLTLVFQPWRRCWIGLATWRSKVGPRWTVLTALLLTLSIGVWGCEMLDRHTIVKGYDIPQRNWLGFSARVQDSIVELAPSFTSTDAVAVLLLDEAELESSVAQRRSYVIEVLESIQEEVHGVVGIALDLVFDEKVDLGGKIDAKLCGQVRQMRDMGISIVTGYSFDEEMNRKPLVDTIHVSSSEDDIGCFNVNQQGHLRGFIQVDQVLRFVPQYLRGSTDEVLPSLSMRGAKMYADSGRQDSYEGPTKLYGGMVWLYGWDGDLVRVLMHEFETKKALLSDRVLFVGFPNNENDLWTTAMGNLYGVEVLAIAADALIQGRSIVGTPNWINIVGMVVQGFYVSFLIFSGVSAWIVWSWVAVVFLTSIGAGIGAMAFSGIWLDVPFMTLSVLFLSLVGLSVRRLKWFRP